MKKNFFTGLGIILPVVFTLLILLFLINLLTTPFLDLAQWILGEMPSFVRSIQAEVILSKLLILGAIVALTLFMGVLGNFFLTHYFIKLGDLILHNIPLVNKIYKAIQDVVHTLFKQDENPRFSKVVLVPFPYKESKALGFVVNDDLPKNSDEEFRDLVSVFVPATPNPTMGFNLLFKKNELTYIDMGVEEALKCIVSCGVMLSERAKK
jgi:uncharacterized membrane protein